MVLLQALTTGYFSFAATAVANVAAAATTRIPGGHYVKKGQIHQRCNRRHTKTRL
jgi:hypothetical protein